MTYFVYIYNDSIIFKDRRKYHNLDGAHCLLSKAIATLKLIQYRFLNLKLIIKNKCLCWAPDPLFKRSSLCLPAFPKAHLKLEPL